MLWFNDPTQPFAAIFALVNPLLRPVPLVVVFVVLVGWVLLGQRRQFRARDSSVLWS